MGRHFRGLCRRLPQRGSGGALAAEFRQPQRLCGVRMVANHHRNACPCGTLGGALSLYVSYTDLNSQEMVSFDDPSRKKPDNRSVLLTFIPKPPKVSKPSRYF